MNAMNTVRRIAALAVIATGLLLAAPTMAQAASAPNATAAAVTGPVAPPLAPAVGEWG